MKKNVKKIIEKVKAKRAKVSHDYVCDVCGKPATINVQDGGFIKYEITPDGDFEQVDSWSEGESNNEFYCDQHEQ